MTRCFKLHPATVLAVVAISAAHVGSQQAPILNDVQRSQRMTAHDDWRAKGRAIPGINSAALRRQALLQKVRMRTALPASSTGGGGSWTSLGPLPLASNASGSGVQDYGWVSGRVTAVAIDSNDPTGNTVFAGAAYGGVWKSTNAGALSPMASSVTWTGLTDAQPTLAIGSIAVQPQGSNPNTLNSVVLAGTGETDSSADSYYGLGILRSADGGKTWNLISQDASGTHNFAGIGFSKIAFSDATPNLVVAAAASAAKGILEGRESPVAQNRGIYLSNDAGNSWTAATIADSGVAISPSSVTSVAYNAAAGTFYAAVRFHGFYSSTNGSNWARLPAQPGIGLSAPACPAQPSGANTCPIYRGEIAIVPNRPGPGGLGEMYVWYVDANDSDQGIWKSVDGGATWLQLNNSGISNCGDLFGGCGTVQGKYNLALAAVPNGTATDIYAGATNLYKCTITNAYPACNGTGSNTFLNLTHVYGCSDIAKVHPDQHAIDFLVSNGTALMYLANDGGVYRALDGFLGLRAGSCGQTNQFDSLNATLGPVTQFVSVSQSSANADLIFGGTQDNGAPATAYAQSFGAWLNVNAGDDGITAINPANDSEWFVAVPPDSASGVNILRCPHGISCQTLDFQNGEVVDSNTLGGDTGPFYLPFLLDRQNSGGLLAGTCRIWRGPSNGGSFTLLSPNFESGLGACTGSEINMVRSLAAGGPAGSSGYSQVIYAGTDGQGPLIPTSPQGGHIWVTTNADAGPTSWVDTTSGINPLSFPISAIAVDPSDPSGRTAYAAVMGFHTPHVWATGDGGSTWIDFSANLPDVPVNAIVVDPGPSAGNGTLYVGTDIGVFASNSGLPNWTELGTASTGFLPNVAVTWLQIFNSAGIRRLRAATYGRGIWEWNLITTPDFQISVRNNPQTVFAGQTATFSGTVRAWNGYASNVNLSCVAGNTSAPQNCSINPSSILPTTQGYPFSISASDQAGDYLFNLQGVGTDPTAITHKLALALHVVDFNLSAPSPNSVSVTGGRTSPPISLQVSAAGAFSGPVTLACSGLPAGAACQFQPASTVAPSASNPVAITLTITTAQSTPSGTSQVTIGGSTPGGPTRTQVLALTVGAFPDYTLAIAIPSLSAQVNSSAVFNGTLTSVNGYSSPVALSCGNAPPPQCTPSPASVVATASGAAFTVTVSSGIAQSYPFNINGVGSDSLSIAHTVPVTFSSLPNQSFDFTMGATPSTQSIAAGQSASYTVAVSPNTGAFPNNVSFSCSGTPAAATCAFNPTQIAAGSANSVSSFTVSTTAPGPPGSAAVFELMFAPMAAMLWICKLQRRSKCRVRMAALAFTFLPSLVSCGGGLQGNGGGGSGNPGTPTGTFTITITATCGAVSHMAQVNLTVTR